MRTTRSNTQQESRVLWPAKVAPPTPKCSRHQAGGSKAASDMAPRAEGVDERGNGVINSRLGADSKKGGIKNEIEQERTDTNFPGASMRWEV